MKIGKTFIRSAAAAALLAVLAAPPPADARDTVKVGVRIREGGKERTHFSFFFPDQGKCKRVASLIFCELLLLRCTHTEMRTLFIISRVCMREEDTGGKGGQ